MQQLLHLVQVDLCVLKTKVAHDITVKGIIESEETPEELLVVVRFILGGLYLPFAPSDVTSVYRIGYNRSGKPVKRPIVRI